MSLSHTNAPSGLKRKACESITTPEISNTSSKQNNIHTSGSSIPSYEQNPYNPVKIRDALYDPDEQLRYRVRALCYLSPGQELYMDTIHWLVNHMVGLHSGVVTLYHPVVRGLVKEGASVDQVKDAEHILREEMSRKLIWLLADVLDQPTRLLNCLHMLIDLAQNIHGLEVDEIRQSLIKQTDVLTDSSSLSIKGQSLRIDQSNQDSSISAQGNGRPRQSPKRGIQQDAFQERHLDELFPSQDGSENSKKLPVQVHERKEQHAEKKSNTVPSGSQNKVCPTVAASIDSHKNLRRGSSSSVQCEYNAASNHQLSAEHHSDNSISTPIVDLLHHKERLITQKNCHQAIEAIIQSLHDRCRYEHVISKIAVGGKMETYSPEAIKQKLWAVTCKSHPTLSSMRRSLEDVLVPFVCVNRRLFREFIRSDWLNAWLKRNKLRA